MSDEGINVRLGADVGDLLTGLNDSKSAMKDAAEGMKGDLDKLISSLGEMGVKALAFGAVALALEGAREAFESCKEAALETANVFERISVMTGIGAGELNKWDMAARMSGTNLDFLGSLVVGTTRSLKQHNEEVSKLIGVDNAAALATDDFGKYLQLVVDKSSDYQDGVARNGFLTMALGRAGAQAGPELLKLVENMDAAKNSVHELGNMMTAEGIEKAKAYEREVGTLSYEWQQMKAAIGDAVLPKLTSNFSEINKMQKEYMAQLQAGISPMRAWWNELETLAGSSTAAQTIANITGQVRVANEEWDDLFKRMHEVENFDKKKTPPNDKKPKAAKEGRSAAIPLYSSKPMYGFDEELVYEAQEGKTKKQVEEEQKAAIEIAKIHSKYDAEEIKRTKKLIEDETKLWMSLVHAVARGFIDDIKAGKSFTDTMTDAFRNMADAVIEMFMQMGEKWAEEQIQAAVTRRVTNTGNVESDAAVAYANAYMSAAAIPVVGWAMAPGVAAEAYTAVMSQLGQASYAVGTPYVPRDMFAQIHKGERIVPADENRRMSQNQGTVIHVHGAIDPHGVAKTIARVLPRASRIAHRNFAMQGA